MKLQNSQKIWQEKTWKLWVCQQLFRQDTKDMIHKRKNWWTSSKLKFLFFKRHCQETIKRQSKDWKKIFAKHISTKTLISCPSIQNSKTHRIKSNLITKWAKDINRHFTKEDKQMANKHMERCSVPLLVKYKLKPQCNIPYKCQKG